MFPPLRNLAATLALAAATIPSAVLGQLQISLEMPNTTVLRCEDVPAIVTIRNNTSLQIPVGGKDGYVLQFDLNSSEGQPVLPNDQNPPLALVLAPGAETVITNNLFRCCKLVDVQQASVVARVDYDGKSYMSRKLFLDVRNGTEIARLQVPNGQRTMVHILGILHRGGHEHLFLQVEDEAGGWIYRAADLGSILRATPPQFMLDGSGQTHVLHRSGPEQYSYHVASADGTFVQFEMFNGDYKTVQMSVNDKGEIIVNGMPAEKGDRPPVLQATPFRPDLHR